jgi:hypothetical protein
MCTLTPFTYVPHRSVHAIVAKGSWMALLPRIPLRRDRLETPDRLHYGILQVWRVGRTSTFSGVWWHRKTRDPTRKATFQTVSPKLFGKEPKASRSHYFGHKGRPIEASSTPLGRLRSSDSVPIPKFQTSSPRTRVNWGERKVQSGVVPLTSTERCSAFALVRRARVGLVVAIVSPAGGRD